MSGLPVVGHGPVAKVYAVTLAGRPVALKVFPAKFDRKTRAAVERERSKLLPLRAPVLAVQGIEQWDGRHAIKMELCTESLAARVKRAGALGMEDVAVLGHSLSRALAAAHRAGVLHGGVTPDNVLFRTSGEPVLSDFGVVLRQAFPRNPLHAIECVPPETLRTGKVTEYSDLYGLGAVLHFALTGESPHPRLLGEQPGERLLRVLSSPVPAVSRPDVPIELSTIVARLLAPDPAHRPQSAATVADRLATMLPTGPTVVVPPRKTKPPRRRRLVLAGTALASLLAVLFVILLGNRDTKTPPPTPAAVVKIELAEPADLGDHVVLTWTSNRTLDFGVVIAADGEEVDVQLAQRNQTAKLLVDSARKYCFRIRGADQEHIYESQWKAVRGATCQR